MVTQVLPVRDMPNLLHTALSLAGSNYYGMKGYFAWSCFTFALMSDLGLLHQCQSSRSLRPASLVFIPSTSCIFCAHDLRFSPLFYKRCIDLSTFQLVSRVLYRQISTFQSGTTSIVKWHLHGLVRKRGTVMHNSQRAKPEKAYSSQAGQRKLLPLKSRGGWR